LPGRFFSQIIQTSSEKQLGLEFRSRRAAYVQKTKILGRRLARVAFRDIVWNRARCLTQLGRQTIPLVDWKGLRDSVDLDSKLKRLLPNDQVFGMF